MSYKYQGSFIKCWRTNKKRNAFSDHAMQIEASAYEEFFFRAMINYNLKCHCVQQFSIKKISLVLTELFIKCIAVET